MPIGRHTCPMPAKRWIFPELALPEGRWARLARSYLPGVESGQKKEAGGVVPGLKRLLQDSNLGHPD